MIATWYREFQSEKNMKLPPVTARFSTIPQQTNGQKVKKFVRQSRSPWV
jgi:hypothetical protein